MVATKVLTLAALIGVASAQVSQCDAQYDAISKLCCGSAGSSSRRVLGEAIPDMATCQLPSTCPKKCAHKLTTYYRKCAGAMGLKSNKPVTALWDRCKSVGRGNHTQASKGWTTVAKARCGYDYKQRFTTLAAAETACKASKTCPGVYSSNCQSTSSYKSYYLCKVGYQPISTYTTYQCVMRKKGAKVVAKPSDSCLSKPCKNGGKCSSTVSQDYTRGSKTYGTYISKATCSCAGTGFMNTRTDKVCGTISSCTSNPCLNGGLCRGNSYSGGFTCSCPKYDATDGIVIGGANCATKFADPCTSNPCQNGGTCQAYASSYSKAATASCRCATGYTGRTCEFKLAPKTPTCKSSPLQRCKMMCRGLTTCPSGQCMMHTDTCCGRKCQADPNAGSTSAAKVTCTAAEKSAGKVPNSCGTQCPAICGKMQQQYCSMMCVLACQCKKGMFYDSKTNKCVTLKACTTAPPPPPPFGMRGGIAIGRPFTEGACNSHVTAAAVTGSEWL